MDLSPEAVGSRRPLDADAIARGLPADFPWHLAAVAETGSTNEDLTARARTGDTRSQVLLTDLQVAGKGRRGRSWAAPRGAALMLSVLLQLPEVPVARRSWIGAIGGLAAIDAIQQTTGLGCLLKWPNDLMIEDRKCAGLLAEAVGDGVVLGIGLNVSQTQAELPVPTATSLALAGATDLDRVPLAQRLLASTAEGVQRWRSHGGDPVRSGLLDAYRQACATLDREVRVLLPDGTQVVGIATDISDDGSLVLHSAGGTRKFRAGDVVHLRPVGTEMPGAGAHAG